MPPCRGDCWITSKAHAIVHVPLGHCFPISPWRSCLSNRNELSNRSPTEPEVAKWVAERITKQAKQVINWAAKWATKQITKQAKQVTDRAAKWATKQITKQAKQVIDQTGANRSFTGPRQAGWFTNALEDD
jgi:hypothetical protein